MILRAMLFFSYMPTALCCSRQTTDRTDPPPSAGNEEEPSESSSVGTTLKVPKDKAISYSASTSTMNWFDALSYCNVHNGTLAMVKDKDIASRVDGYLRAFDPYGKKRFWIGLSDLALKGDYYWVDSSEADYSNWYPGEPNHALELSFCVFIEPIDHNHQWNDDDCRKSDINALCQMMSNNEKFVKIDNSQTA